MKIAIITNDASSYPKPMSLGLHRMLLSCGIDSVLFFNGWKRVRQQNGEILSTFRDLWTLKPIRVFINSILQKKFFDNLRNYDGVVIVSHMPAAYLNYFLDDKLLRAYLEKRPLILYDLVYLPTRGEWPKALKMGNSQLGIPEGGHWGIERYDWHLCGSVVSETPFPIEPQPCSMIGLNLNDGSLYSEQKEFCALLDFERPEFASERSIQKLALKEAGIPYRELKGQYSISEIKKIYRQTAIFLISFRESFGLPICEVQACGGLIATPYDNWVPSHWIKENLHLPGPGRLGENFLVYDNDLNKLIEILKKAKQRWLPSAIREKFIAEYPQYFFGDTTELKKTFANLFQKNQHPD